MNKKKIIKQIIESLNNLDSVKITNTLKAEAIYDALEPLLPVTLDVEEKKFKNTPFFMLKEVKNDSH